MAAHLSREEEVAQLWGKLEKWLKMLKRDFELHKKSILLKARQNLEGMLVREEEAEAALRLERDF